jgi:hypothetical protein
MRLETPAECRRMAAGATCQGIIDQHIERCEVERAIIRHIRRNGPQLGAITISRLLKGSDGKWHAVATAAHKQTLEVFTMRLAIVP